jgi:hypothetical protein
MLDREAAIVLRRFSERWEDFLTELARLNGAAEVRPSDSVAIFKIHPTSPPHPVKVELAPIVFNLPERAGNLSIDLFVVIHGLLAVERSTVATATIMKTDTFATKVGYFRRTPSFLTHVFGAHYDFAPNDLGHPAFHGQFKSFCALSSHIRTHYKVTKPDKDLVDGILKNVRVPTAQMDFFSLFVQLCADHLMFNRSGPDEKTAFNSLLRVSTFCQGAAYQLPRLTDVVAGQCYRARHWYPIII